MEYKSYHYHYYHHYTTSLKIAVGETQIFSMPNISHIWMAIYIYLEYVRNLVEIEWHLIPLFIIKSKVVIA